MAVVETERNGQVLIVRMNRPERLNALNAEMRQTLAETWTEFRHCKELEVAIFTGTGRGFCAGEDMKESLATGTPGGTRPPIPDPFMDGTLEKPVIAAVNGFAMGGGFMLVERTDLRVAVPEAVFEVSEAKRWLLGGYNHGHLANLPYPIAMEMALGFRFTAERFYQVGFLNRLVPQAELIPTAMAMAEHLLSLPPASRVNTVHMMRQMRPEPSRCAQGARRQAARARRQERPDGVARRLRRKAQAQLQGLARPAGPVSDAEDRGRQMIFRSRSRPDIGRAVAEARQHLVVVLAELGRDADLGRRLRELPRRAVHLQPLAVFGIVDLGDVAVGEHVGIVGGLEHAC